MWKNMKNRKAQTFAEIELDIDSSLATPICPTNCGYQILNGLYMPVMHLNYSLLD